MKPGVLRGSCVVVVAVALGLGAAAARAEAPPAELAKQLANPLASLISIPFQYNHDGGIGPRHEERSLLNIQPVVPLTLGKASEWKLLSRTVVPLVELTGARPGGGDVSGVGDVTQSLFVTPVAPSRGGWLLGAGPVLQAPSGSDALLTTERWSLGPTAVGLRQVGPWTYGALSYHLWSVSDPEGGGDVSTTFVQPFVNYVTRTRATFALNTEATYDWERRAWSVPVHGIVNQLLKVGPQPISLCVGARWWAAAPEQGPEDWGLRAGATLLFVPSRLRGE